MKLNEEVIHKVLQIDWLSNCGREGSLPKHLPFSTLGNQKAVKKSIDSVKWENVRLEEVNNLTGFLAKNHSDVFNGYWNTLVMEIKHNILPDVHVKAMANIVKHNLPLNILHNVEYDAVNILMVLSYREYYESKFYNMLYEVYATGHLPCGWNGKYPRGNLLVY
ncbi:hypothetical protein [Priestia endophytica]|uniref:hypothetical protein n=1 Tax=Priestia endophytica TaxID=135735 RepID=UPI00227E3689|nr:hypothetical protein [Priestia endophytica]MCY8232251.1 hypothetical protein [Priestia endophytica]